MALLGDIELEPVPGVAVGQDNGLSSRHRIALASHGQPVRRDEGPEARIESLGHIHIFDRQRPALHLVNESRIAQKAQA